LDALPNLETARQTVNNVLSKQLANLFSLDSLFSNLAGALVAFVTLRAGVGVSRFAVHLVIACVRDFKAESLVGASKTVAVNGCARDSRDNGNLCAEKQCRLSKPVFPLARSDRRFRRHRGGQVGLGVGGRIHV
jgi:hypothetical protein